MSNEDVLDTIKDERNTLHTTIKRKFSWIRHILLTNCLVEHFIGGKIAGRVEVTGRRGIRLKQLL